MPGKKWKRLPKPKSAIYEPNLHKYGTFLSKILCMAVACRHVLCMELGKQNFNLVEAMGTFSHLLDEIDLMKQNSNLLLCVGKKCTDNFDLNTDDTDANEGLGMQTFNFVASLGASVFVFGVGTQSLGGTIFTFASCCLVSSAPRGDEKRRKKL